MYGCVYMCVWVYMCVCVCVCGWVRKFYGVFARHFSQGEVKGARVLVSVGEEEKGVRVCVRESACKRVKKYCVCVCGQK